MPNYDDSISDISTSRDDELGPFRWYVVHTYSNYEEKVKEALKNVIKDRNLWDYFEKVGKDTIQRTVPRKAESVDDLGLDVPEELSDNSEAKKSKGKGKKGKTEKDKREKKSERSILDTDYIYLKMRFDKDNLVWNAVRNIRGCTGFVGADPKNPLPLTAAEVAAMGLEENDSESSFNIGDQIIKSGQLFMVLQGEYRGEVGHVVSAKKIDGCDILVLETEGDLEKRQIEVSYDDVDYIELGDRRRVISGPLAGQEGTIVSVRKSSEDNEVEIVLEIDTPGGKKHFDFSYNDVDFIE